MPSPYSRIHRLRKGEKCELTIFLNNRIFESRRPHSIQAGILFGEFLFRPMVALNINLDHWKLHMSSNPHLNLASKQQNASINRAAFIIMRTLVFECQHDNKYTNKASVFRKRPMWGSKFAFHRHGPRNRGRNEPAKLANKGVDGTPGCWNYSTQLQGKNVSTKLSCLFAKKCCHLEFI